MNHQILEQELRKHMKRTKIIEGIASGVFLAVIILFAVLYEQSRVVETVGSGFLQYEQVTYNYKLGFGVLIGALGFIPSIIFLICDCLFTKLVTLEVGQDYVTFHRGIAQNTLYINGECKDSLSLFGYYLEAPLSDGSKVTVSLGKWSCHITFSNGSPAVDI